MADLPELPSWLARKISLFIQNARTGQITLNFTDRRIQGGYVLQESGRIRDNGDQSLE